MAPHPVDTEARAAAWLIRSEAGAAVRDEWQAWLRQDIRHRIAFLRAQKGWRRADRLSRLRPWDGAVNLDVLCQFPGLPTVRPARVKQRYQRGALAFATMALLAGVWLSVMRARSEVHHTPRGGFERVALPDGSTALLNTNSEIEVRFTSRRREIVLTRGEALFTVAHAGGRPFEVTAGNDTVRAIATAFAVRLRAADAVEVLVSRGRVSVAQGSSDDPPELLTAGQHALIDAKGPSRVDPVDPPDIDHRLAWTRGRIWFQETTLAEAVEEFNRYNRRQLVLADAALAQQRIGGTFVATDPSAFLSALERVFGIRARSASAADGTPIIALNGASD